MTALRSTLFNVAFYANLILQMIFWTPYYFVAPRRRAWLVPKVWVRSSLWLQKVVGGTATRDQRPGEPAGRLLHTGAQAPIVLGRDRLPAGHPRRHLHPQARVDVDPAVRLVRRQDAHDPDRSRHPLEGAAQGRDDRARAHEGRPPAHHLSRGHAPAAGRRAGLQIRHRGALCAARPAGRAGGPQCRPLLAAPAVPALSRHHQGALSAADPAGARSRGVPKAADRRDRDRMRCAAGRGGALARPAAAAADGGEAARASWASRRRVPVSPPFDRRRRGRPRVARPAGRPPPASDRGCPAPACARRC